VTNSESNIMAILLGLGVFAIIVAIGWRSVQNRRILRLQGADGKETIIVAREDDEISSVTTTETSRTEPEPAPAPSVLVVNTGVADPAPAPVPVPAPAPAPAPEFGRKAVGSEASGDVDPDVIGSDRAGRGDSSAG
jgi:hypothetical protein